MKRLSQIIAVLVLILIISLVFYRPSASVDVDQLSVSATPTASATPEILATSTVLTLTNFEISTTTSVKPTLEVYPSTSVMQGEPLMMVIDATEVTGTATATATATLPKITFSGVPLHVFLYKSKPTAFIGIDLYKKPGTYTLKATLTDGQTRAKNVKVIERPRVTAPLGIPEKLGGNTPASQTHLVNSLNDENTILASLKSASEKYWSQVFHFPVADPIVTDPYGYMRVTGAYDIAHKGTDFKAPPGTPVMALNRGVVRLVQDFPTYGNTIVVDHGLGLMSFYMHLSKVGVTQGQTVERGQVIGVSGETGYTEGAHLHLTMRIDGVSIDPMKFMDFFK
jgi:murein DD-endopeptidase MepM/ murein hydrolase activator NlpD